MPPPPGWYPDPSYPGSERWWDGTAWTDHRRTPAQTAAYPPVHPQQDPAAGSAVTGSATTVIPPPAAAGGGRAKAVALGVAGAALVASIVTGVLVLRDDDGEPEGSPAPTAPPADEATGPTATPSSPEPGTSAPDEDPDTLVDQLNGITLPVPKGWEKADDTVGNELALQTPDTYDCPGDPGLCRQGKITSSTVTGSDERSPEKLARADIKDAAEAAYDEDSLERKPFGGITGHRQVKAGTVAVGGRSGYFVRWRVHTEEGPGGHVQSLVFPSSTGSEAMIMVRFTIDAGRGAPPLSDIDEVIDGIRPVGDGVTGGGVGNSVEPAP